MKNIVIVVIYSLLVLWFALSMLSVNSVDSTGEVETSSWQHMKEQIERSFIAKGIDLGKVASIYGVDFQAPKSNESEAKDVLTQLHLISIYESGEGRKARIQYTDSQGNGKIQDYKIHEKLLGYQLAEITKSEVILLNNSESFSLKPFSSKKLDVKVLTEYDGKVADENN